MKRHGFFFFLPCLSFLIISFIFNTCNNISNIDIVVIANVKCVNILFSFSDLESAASCGLTKKNESDCQGGRNRWSQWSQGFTGNQSFYYREILRSWIYEGGNFLCFTGKKLVPTPLHLEFLKMLSSFCCIKTNSFFKYQIEISSLQIKE